MANFKNLDQDQFEEQFEERVIEIDLDLNS